MHNESHTPRVYNDDQLLTARQLCQLLSLPKSSFYALLASRQIPEPLRIGTRTRWRWSTIRNLLDALESSATTKKNHSE